MKSTVRFLFLGLMLSAGLPFSSGLEAGAELNKAVADSTLVKVGQSAPDFTCQTIDGRKFTLSALKGKVVVLYYFTTSVGACITEMKYLEKEIVQKLRDREDFQLIAIGRGHSHEELVKMGGENKFTFPLVADPRQELYQLYFSKFVPRTMMVRKDGSIAYLVSGYHEFGGIVELQAALKVALAEKQR